MSSGRRYHEPGVGARTGITVEDDAFDLDDFMAAGRKAMNLHIPRHGQEQDSGESEREDTPGVGRSEHRDEKTARRASSSMVIADSLGPSPHSTIRRSQTPSSSPFLSSPGTARHRSSPPYESMAREEIEVYDRFEGPSEDSTSISSPSKKSAPKKRKILSAGLEARRGRKELGSKRAESIPSDEGSVAQSHQDMSCQATDDENGDDYYINYADRRSPVHEWEVDQNLDPAVTPGTDEAAAAAATTTSKKAETASVSRRKGLSPPPKKKSKSILQEKNSYASQSVAQKAKQSMKRKGINLRAEHIPRANAAHTIVEKIPSSYHRQVSVDVAEGDEDGVRRGSRYRYKPLEYWRGEKARFGRPSLPRERSENAGDETIDGDAFEDHFAGDIPPVAVLKEIIRVPREEGEGTFSGMKIRRERVKDTDKPIVTVKKAKPKESSVNDMSSDDGKLDPSEPTKHAEAGWDEATEMRGMVWDVETKTDVEMQTACTSSQVRTRLAVNSTFGFEKVFVVDHAMATGILSILVDGQKPLKSSKDNNYSFVVLEGAVRVQIHKRSFVIAPHGMFFVPRGNDYSIANISKRVAKIAFTQCRNS